MHLFVTELPRWMTGLKLSTEFGCPEVTLCVVDRTLKSDYFKFSDIAYLRVGR